LLLYLINKEIKLELRNKYALGGIFLYVIATVYTSYLSFKNIIHPATWNALFWIIMLFASINAISKSFVQDSNGRQLYYYTILKPQTVILSKMIYNAILMVFMSLLCFAFYSVFINYLVQNLPMFLLSLLLGSIGFSTILTMVSAIAAKTNGNFSMMAILSFPMLIPFLITLIKVSKLAVDGIDNSVCYPYLLVLILINIVVVGLSYILFPYLWQD
jgi:heme exporter protein B